MSLAWITSAFENLPGCSDSLFRSLWGERRLKFTQGLGSGDLLDEYNARLVCAALTQRERLLLILPDLQPHRPPLLFATALLRYWWDSRSISQNDYRQSQSKRVVLYFGTTVGMREHLKQTTVAGMGVDLAAVFQQYDLGRQRKEINATITRGNKGSPDSDLPRVVTIYAPADPVTLVEQYQPSWIAIDCSDVADISWLHPLLEVAKQSTIPVIAWGQNPLSDYVSDFAKDGQVFVCPARAILEGNPLQVKTQLVSVQFPLLTTRIQPIIIESEDIGAVEALIPQTSRKLVLGSQQVSGSLGKDALMLHWRYLRSLEALSVPVDFYEVEAPRFWGLKSFEQLQTACAYFRDACYQNYRELGKDLEEAFISLQRILTTFKSSAPPLWDALCNLCVEEVTSGEARLLTFPSQARKQLFLLALLARYNITEEDLHALRIWVISLDELRHWMYQLTIAPEVGRGPASLIADTTLQWHPILVGLPSPLLTSKLLPIFLQKQTDILLYPHQNPALVHRVTEWKERLDPHPSQAARVIERLHGRQISHDFPLMPPKLEVAEPIELNSKSTPRRPFVQTQPLWEPVDELDELTKLLQPDEDIDEDEFTPTSQLIEPAEQARGGEDELWCKDAIQVHFDQDWYGTFASDAILNVIVPGSSGVHLDKRYIRSLKPGYRVMLIHGQRRQNLYDLILSRIHKNPGIELHLALIRRWQDDFNTAYQRWRKHEERNLDELLRQMQERGSKLTSPTTLRQWLWGNALCPNDVQDLYRLAEVLDLGFVRQYHLRIDVAARRIRGLHRGLSNRINHWLEQQLAGEAAGNDGEIIDADLGLTFGDFRNSLLVLQIVEMKPISGPFLRSHLGRLERGKDVEYATRGAKVGSTFDPASM